MKIDNVIAKRLILVGLMLAMTMSPLVFAGAAGAATTITISPTSLVAATGDISYSQTFTASGGKSPYTFSYTGSLPAGMSLASSGKLSGTPTAPAGNFTFTVTATDTNKATGSANYTLTVNAPTITIVPATPPSANQYRAYSGATFTASGGKSPYTFSYTGSLPAGMSLSSSGKLSGTPTAAGSFPLTVTATDGNGFTGSQGCTLTVAPAPTITISNTTPPPATVYMSYSTNFTASGGTAPYAFSASGPLPGGMTFSNSNPGHTSNVGVLSGAPTTAGTYNFTVAVTDTYGDPGSANCTLVVNAPTITITPTTLPAATGDTSYSQTFSAKANGYSGSYTFTSGSLPNGLSLSLSGVLSGTPEAPAGTFPFTVTAKDTNGFTGSQNYTLTVNAPTITIVPTTLPAANQYRLYTGATFTASGGKSPYTFKITSGALPTGMTLTTGGVLSGTPTQAGSFPLTVTATDGNGFTGSQGCTLTVGAAPTITISNTTPPPATVYMSYSTNFTASGGTAPYAFSITSGSLPAGLNLSTSGVLSGTPTQAGTFTFTVAVTDTYGDPGSAICTLVVNAPTITITPTTLPAATGDTSYSQTFSATANGYSGSYTFSITSGSLPGGLSLASSGKLSGTPTAPAGNFTFTVTATDTNNFTGSANYTLTVNAPTITIVPATLPAANQYRLYTGATFTASGGKSPYTFKITSGALPGGMTLTTGGVLSGTPTQAGSFPLTVTATDGNGFTGSQGCTLTVGAAPVITITPTTLPAATVYMSYTTNFTASGGTSPYTFSITSGSLPAGLNLSTGGVLSGTPTQAGHFSFTVAVTDTYGDPGSANCTLVVNAPISIVISNNTMYVTATGLTPKTPYLVSYQDSTGAVIDQEVDTADNSGDLSSQYNLSSNQKAQPGTWTISISNDNTGALIATTTYDVPPTDIPEFPAPLAVLLVIGSCAAVYFWMRKRHLEGTV